MKKDGLDSALRQIAGGRYKPRTRDYVGLENAIKNAKRKQQIIFAMSRRSRKKKATPEVDVD